MIAPLPSTGTFVFRGTRAAAVDHVRRVVAQITGREAPAPAVVEDVMLPAAVTLLSRVQLAFIDKADGRTGDDGITWKPLKRSTIAGRRTTRGELKSLGITGKRERGFLTPAENRRWKDIFGTRTAHFMAMGMDKTAAMGKAAAIAWATLKREGAKTKLEVLGGRHVQMGRDTGRLFASLTPGFEAGSEQQGDQVLKVEPGRITVGSRVPYAERFHKFRPLWPADLPGPWLEAIGNTMARGLIRAAAKMNGA